MVFFFSDNPIALFLALVLIVVLLRIVLGRHKLFEGKSAAYVTLVLIAVIILLVAYRPLLSIASFSIPFLVLVVLFLFGVGALLFALGMPRENIWPALKVVGPLRTGLIIVIVCVIALGVSRVYGEKLLEEPSVSIADPMMPDEEPVEIDFSPLFTKQALGLITVLVVLGLAFIFVNLMR